MNFQDILYEKKDHIARGPGGPGTGREPSAHLFGELQGLFSQLYLIGDAVKPRWTYNATAEGATVALGI